MRQMTALARNIHRDQGVGFWSKSDAISHAGLEFARTGEQHDVIPQQSPMGSHVLWFVRVARRAVA